MAPVLYENTNVFCTAPTDNQTGLGLVEITKFDNPPDGETVQDGITIDVDGGTVDWDSGTIDVGAVIVKGGSHSNVYFYTGGATGDTDLVTALNRGGNRPTVSHVSFCAPAAVVPTETPTETPTPTVSPTIVESEPEDETSVLPTRFTKPKTLPTTGAGDSALALAGAGLLLLGIGIRTVRRPVTTE